MHIVSFKYTWATIACILLTANVFANNEIFQQAEKLYIEKQYESALELYKSLEKENVHSATLYYNIGNCHYRLHNIAYAIWYYERALKLKPNDEEIKNNLLLVNQKTKDNISVNENINLNNWLVSFSSFFDSDNWAWLSFIFFLMFWISITLFFYTENKILKRFSLNMVFVHLAFTLLTWYFSYAAYKNTTQHTHAIIFQSTAHIKTEPNEKSPTAFVLHEGSKVKVESKKNDWYYIRIDINKTGWLQAEYLKEI